MKDRKRRYEIFSFYDYTGIEKHLEKMAKKGWMLEKISALGWVYRKIEPAKLKFTVCYFSKSSEFDSGLTNDEITFHEFCEHTGWKLAASRAQIHVFYNENQDSVPIETDAAVKVENMHKAMKKSYLPAYLMLFGIAVLNSAMFISRAFSDPLRILADTTSLFGGFVWLLVFIVCIAEIGGYYIWRNKAKKKAEQGEFATTRGCRNIQIFTLFAVGIGCLYWLSTLLFKGTWFTQVIMLVMIAYMIALLVSVNGIKVLLKKAKASRGVNRTVTFASSFILSFIMLTVIGVSLVKFANNIKPDEQGRILTGTISQNLESPPLTAQDLYDVSMDEYISERTGNESIFAVQFTSRQYPKEVDLPSLEYTVTTVKTPFLYDLCREQLVGRNHDEMLDGKVVYANHYEKVDAPYLEASEVYRWYRDDGYINRYLLVYQDSFVEITFDAEPTEAQMIIVEQKLSVI